MAGSAIRLGLHMAPDAERKASHPHPAGACCKCKQAHLPSVPHTCWNSQSMHCQTSHSTEEFTGSANSGHMPDCRCLSPGHGLSCCPTQQLQSSAIRPLRLMSKTQSVSTAVSWPCLMRLFIPAMSPQIPRSGLSECRARITGLDCRGH